MLIYVHPIWDTPGDIAIQKREIDYIKIKIVSFMFNILSHPYKTLSLLGSYLSTYLGPTKTF